MPDSTFVFEQGAAIEVGYHGETDFVFAGGEPVVNAGQSTTVFEGGIGIGPGTFRATLFESGTKVDESPAIRNSTYLSGGIAFIADAQSFSNGTDIDAIYDNYQLSDGTTIDDFSDGNLDEYGGLTSYASVSSGELVLSAEPSNGGKTTSIQSLSGLAHYPAPGDTFEWEMRAQSNSSGMGAGWATQDTTSSTGALPDGYNVFAAPGGTRADEWVVRVVDNGSTADLYSASVGISAGTQYRVVVEWL